MFVEVIVAVGESKSTVRSAEFHWYKFQWVSNWWIQWVLCNILLNNFISASLRSYALLSNYQFLVTLSAVWGMEFSLQNIPL